MLEDKVEGKNFRVVWFQVFGSFGRVVDRFFYDQIVVILQMF